MLLFVLAVATINIALAADFVYDSHDRKDPFAPPVVEVEKDINATALVGVQLEGIIWDEANPLAVVNGKIVMTGDIVAGVEVIRITENEVIFNVNEQEVPVKLRIEIEEEL